MNACGHSWTMPADGAVRQIGFGVMATWYASWGYAVLPLERGGKRPHRMLGDRGGVHWATRDTGRIWEMWSTDPAAGIGVATGGRSRLLVVDCDVKNGKDGLSLFGDFMSLNWLALPAGTPAVTTPSGGRHYWLRMPEGATVPERPGILPGVDVKADGGYVAAPPCARLVYPAGLDGEPVGQPVAVPYQWAAGCPCSAPQAPDWIYQWIASAPAGGYDRSGPVMAAMDIERLEREGVPRGQRNHALYRVACSLYRKFGTGPLATAEVIKHLEQVRAAGDTTDFPVSELRTCAESARRFIVRCEAEELAARAGYADWVRHGGR